MFLGIDLGTGSVKVLLLDADGTTLGRGGAGYEVVSSRPSWAESDPEAWWRSVGEAVREAVGDRAAEVAAVGLSGQMHGVILTDEDGTALRPAVLWADGRAEEELARYRALAPDLMARLANPIVTGMAGPTLLWCERHERERYRAARWALQPKDWLRLRLTGAAASDPSDASATLLYDLYADGWAEGVIAALGLRRELLPPLLASAAPAGRLREQAAAHLGLPAEIPVATGASDTAASMFGSGLSEPGTAQLTVGTGAQLIVPIDRRPTVPVALAALHGTHLYRAAPPDLWYAMAAMQNAGLVLEWVRRLLGLSWPEFYRAAAEAPAGSAGAIFHPYLSGERTPHLYSRPRGAWLGLGLHHGRAHLARAAFEGVAFSIADGLAALEARGVEVGSATGRIRLAGGGTREAWWRQLLADALGRTLEVVAVPEASARGAALLAGAAAGRPIDPPTLQEGTSIAPGDERQALGSALERFRDSAYRVDGAERAAYRSPGG